MERRVAGRVLGFLIGSAGVVLAVFVVLPWLEAPQRSAHHPESRDASLEEVLASFGIEDAGEESDTANKTAEVPTVSPVSSALLPVGVDGPTLVLGMDPPAAADTEWLDAEAPQAAVDEAETLSRKGAGVWTSEAESASTEPDAEWEDGSPGAKSVAEPVLVVTDAAKAQEPMAAESAVAGKNVAPAFVPLQDVGIPVTADPAPAVESVPDTPPMPKESFPKMKAARQSSGPGLPRLEFDMPEAAQVVETSLEAGDRPPSSSPVAPAVPLSEFSPRSFSVSALRPTADVSDASAGRAETLDHSVGRSGTAQPYPVPVPNTLRGVMGYRLPLVSRQEVPDQVVSGVLIPAHTTYVILKPGYWELTGLSPDDVNALRVAAERAKADQQTLQSEPAGRGWNPFRLFKRKRAPAAGN